MQPIEGRAVRRYGRQCVAIHVGQSLKGTDVVAVMDWLRVELDGVPKRIQVGNGSEFIRSGGPLKSVRLVGL